jgi:hypothetical protein
MDISSLIIPLVLAIVAASPGIYALIAQRNKVKADAVKTEAQAAEIIQRVAAKQIAQYQKRVDELEIRIVKLEDELQDTLDCLIGVVEGGHKLYGQVKELGQEPVYTPPNLEIITRQRRRTAKATGE